MTSGKPDDLLYFEASARLQRLIGRDLIPDDYSAVEELVKNAYDSNATEATITIVRPSGSYEGEIEIKDNGLGLSFRDFKRVWMRAGYSEKTAQPLPETGRVQVGEKGIGRFAADKLGKHLVVVTKTYGAREALKVTFDWERFSDKKRLLNKIGMPYENVEEPLLPKRDSGTILRITKLRAGWPAQDIEELRRRLSRLLNPYDSTGSFQITLKAPVRKLSGAIVPSEIEDADFEWNIDRDAEGMVTVRRRERTSRGLTEWKEWDVVRPAYLDETPSAREFGPAKARLFFFVSRPKKASIGNALSGVSVYRDGLRVEPAGSENADWLGLLEKRAKRAGHMPLVPSRLFGFVDITREDNPDLYDATNRRTIIHGPKLEGFREFLKQQLGELEAQVEARVLIMSTNNILSRLQELLALELNRCVSASLGQIGSTQEPEAPAGAKQDAQHYVVELGSRVASTTSVNSDRIRKH